MENRIESGVCYVTPVTTACDRAHNAVLGRRSCFNRRVMIPSPDTAIAWYKCEHAS